MRTLIFGLFGICMFGATVFLFVLLIRALLKYLRSGEVRKEKAEAKKTLGEALKAHRTRCKMTQEFVAESLGVSRQAVSKWESGLSQPELAIIVELADLFDTSVDVLLGYEVKDNRRQTTAERLRRYRTEKDRAGLAEAEKALQNTRTTLRSSTEARDFTACSASWRGTKRCCGGH